MVKHKAQSLLNKGQAVKEGSLWQADHVDEVADGGGHATVDDIQTLCVWCHADKTRRSAGSRALARRMKRARPGPGGSGGSSSSSASASVARTGRCGGSSSDESSSESSTEDSSSDSSSDDLFS